MIKCSSGIFLCSHTTNTMQWTTFLINSLPNLQQCTCFMIVNKCLVWANSPPSPSPDQTTPWWSCWRKWSSWFWPDQHTLGWYRGKPETPWPQSMSRADYAIYVALQAYVNWWAMSLSSRCWFCQFCSVIPMLCLTHIWSDLAKRHLAEAESVFNDTEEDGYIGTRCIDTQGAVRISNVHFGNEMGSCQYGHSIPTMYNNLEDLHDFCSSAYICDWGRSPYEHSSCTY